LTGFRDILPLGFTYKLSSTSGDLTSNNPLTTLLTDGRWQLDWTFSSAIQIQAGVTKTIVFKSEAQVAKGNYSNEGFAFYKGHGITVDKSSTVQGDLIASNSKVRIKKSVVLNGQIRAGGKVDVNKDASIQLDVVATGDVKLNKNASVGGDVSSAGQVELGQGATVTGTIQEQASGLTIVPLELLSPSTLAAGGQDETVQQNQTLTLSPGSYGKLELKKGSTLNLSTGQYAFESVKADKDSTIRLDLTEGAIVVDVAENLELNKDVEIVIVSEVGSASDVTFRVQQGVRLKKSGQFVGTFLALGPEKSAAFSWPSAVVRVMDVFQINTTNANGEIGSLEAWVGLDYGLINRPIIDR
jgi:cytoskeletal protein CcmA (bactofilin family)